MDAHKCRRKVYLHTSITCQGQPPAPQTNKQTYKQTNKTKTHSAPPARRTRGARAPAARATSLPRPVSGPRAAARRPGRTRRRWPRPRRAGPFFGVCFGWVAVCWVRGRARGWTKREPSSRFVTLSNKQNTNAQPSPLPPATRPPLTPSLTGSRSSAKYANPARLPTGSASLSRSAAASPAPSPPGRPNASFWRALSLTPPLASGMSP
jgi:hypothetical protein